MKTTILLSGLLLSASSLSISANENTETTTTDNQVTALDTVKVSADFRDLDLQQIPSAITVIGEDDIQNRNANHLESILSLAPNVNFATGASRGRYIQIRGIGERSQFVDPVNPSVGLIIDGIDMTGLGGAASLFDVEQVEILRGPQGTAFGANALSGAINIKSKQPTQETEGYAQAKLGNYNTLELGTAISGSLSKTLKARLAINHVMSDGYMENNQLDRKDTNNIDEVVARAQFTLNADSNNDIKLSLLGTNIDNGYDAFTLDNTRNTQSDEPGQDTQDTKAGSISWINRKNRNYIFEALISTSNTDSTYSYDEDWVYDGYHAYGYTSFDEYIRDQTKNTMDVRLLSTPESTLPSNTKWVIGAYALQKDETLDRNNTDTTKNLNSTFTLSTQALYSQFTTEISNTTSLIYGVRIEDWSNDYNDSNNITEKKDETLWGGKVTIETLPTAFHLIYASIARGYKAGGINSNTEIPESNRTFDTEYNNSLEIGIKSSLLSDQLTTRLAAFYIQRKNQQVKNSIEKQELDNSVSFKEFYDNATEGENHGLELEANWSISKNLTWSSSVGYLNTKFKDYSYTDKYGITYNNDGRAQGHAPEWSLHTSIKITLNQSVGVVLEAEGKDEFYLSDSQDEKSNAYGLIHAQINYQLNKLKISLNGRNLTNKDYATRGFGFGNDPTTNYTPTKYIQFGEPRLISLSARYDF
jgi:iron complex outermembrane receptor protein